MRAVPPAITPRSSTEPAALRLALAVIRRCRSAPSAEPARGRQPPPCGPPETPHPFRFWNPFPQGRGYETPDQ